MELTEINRYVNTTYVNGDQQEAKTVTCYSKARFTHHISRAKFYSGIERIGSSTLTKIKFDNLTSVTFSTEPVKSRQKFNCCLLC